MTYSSLSFFSHVPLTTRSIGVSAIASYLLVGPPKAAFDVVATYLGYGLAFALCYCLLGGLVSRFFAKRTTTVTLLPIASAEGRFVAGRPVKIHATTTAGRRLPFFRLRISPVWPSAELAHPLPELRAFTAGSYDSDFPVTVPHRGEWNVSHYVATYQDILGLTRFCWEGRLSHMLSLTIYPPDAVEQDLPVTSSRRSSGDSEIAETLPDGEPFDLKRYDPSDGTRRIVWKIFARTGQLIARHPEASVQPEGKTTVFAIADHSEDSVAAQVYQYTCRAAALGIEVRFGCHGMQESPVARNSDDALRLLLDCVWNCHPGQLVADAERFVTALSEEAGESSRQPLAVFLSARRLSDPAQGAVLQHARRVFESQGMELVWYVIRDYSADSPPQFSPAMVKHRGQWWSWWFLGSPRFSRSLPTKEQEAQRLSIASGQLGGRVVYG